MPYAGIALLGGFLGGLSDADPGRMPVWAPWEFSPLEYLACALVTLWFFQGLAREPVDERPARWRRIVFVGSIGALYAVLRTRYDYWAQHLFVLNRIQHVVMHHLGPFFIALAGVGPTVRRGMPRWARRVVDSRAVAAAMRAVQQPALAAVLFVGSFFFWLIPPVHFRAMIDDRLYQLMNWSMVVDGILFWSLVVDFRPRPPARISFGARLAVVVGAMIPQGVLGLLLALWPRDLYSYYALCGRLLPSMSAITDQHLGGIVIWLPPELLSMALVLMLVVTMSKRKLAARVA